MAQKLLLFWRKPARRCWWEGVELDDVEGVEGKLKVWIRRVWTLEMVSRDFHSVRVYQAALVLISMTECYRSALAAASCQRHVIFDTWRCYLAGARVNFHRLYGYCRQQGLPQALLYF